MISDEHDAAARHRSAADTATPPSSLVPPQAAPSHTLRRTAIHDRDDADESHLVRGYD
ncbi:hypothetical protein DFQ14_102433 [Halopolyspora algeriensis]|uniref:Uncharacterized protein n=1 Tax=Halopolyspora algeriensis TaxID=1500506 RepID=A0A368W0M1_9ACTN|nr:hypothetical protein [Halopolyspora algeriensis]RCW46131.1 hypothetical protein DFQ14_102433 [Halopolyspora algeriensis]TQM55534.1 hypothetical protein FHU43_0308 [Halopolyspora algeriensis]